MKGRNLTVVTVVCRPHGKSPCLRRYKVAAEYYRIVDGALIFRNYRPDNYPETVRVFAPGYWLEIIPDAQ